jgi:hypothetical protein
MTAADREPPSLKHLRSPDFQGGRGRAATFRAKRRGLGLKSPPGAPLFLTSHRVPLTCIDRAFFALIFDRSLRVMPPSVMRNARRSPLTTVVRSSHWTNCGGTEPALVGGEQW